VQEQGRLTGGHLHTSARQRYQPLVDRREHGDEQPAADASLSQRLQGSVDPRLLVLRSVAGDPAEAINASAPSDARAEA
jgi:hypothetical protein